jgi:potassium-transporting ATPase KdpC subunit
MDMKEIWITIKLFAVMTVITGILYPLAITGAARIAFPAKAAGSLVSRNGEGIGSRLIGQAFGSDIYFHGRPSAIAYNTLPSGGSNLGLTSRVLDSLYTLRVDEFTRVNKLNSPINIPAEMLFASGSGLDPDISPAAALLQVNRICNARHFLPEKKTKVIELVHRMTEQPVLGVLGEPRVNVLSLNLELDKIR